jgi:hypothetical protein
VVEHLSFQHGICSRTTGYRLGGALVSGESTAAVSRFKVRSAPEGTTVIRHMPTPTHVANVVNFTRHSNFVLYWTIAVSPGANLQFTSLLVERDSA